MTQHLHIAGLLVPHRHRQMGRIGRSLAAMTLIFSLVGIEFGFVARKVHALPPPEDTPEEILRAEIILEARSPIDGKPLTAAEYAELQAALADPAHPPSLDSELQHLIFLLRVRRMLRTLVPPVRLLEL